MPVDDRTEEPLLALYHLRRHCRATRRSSTMFAGDSGLQTTMTGADAGPTPPRRCPTKSSQAGTDHAAILRVELAGSTERALRYRRHCGSRRRQHTFPRSFEGRRIGPADHRRNGQETQARRPVPHVAAGRRCPPAGLGEARPRRRPTSTTSRNVHASATASTPSHGYQSHPNFYHGLVSPAYEHHCLKYHYWGPAFFAGVCWYPQWNPWVEWSWHYHCHPFWDPRPIWCRPVIYDPCPRWVYWEAPVWTPLPVVTCGTWVDLRPVVVAAAQSDLQLVAVRFVDPGHPEEKLGPRIACGSATTAAGRSRSRSTSCCLRATTKGCRPICRRPACA